MASQWYYAIGDQESGPVAAQELKKLADSGQLSPNDQVWKEGMADWVDASKIPNLFKSAPAPTPGQRAAPSPSPVITPSPTPQAGAPVINTGDGRAPTINTGAAPGAPVISTGDSGAPTINPGAAPGAPVIGTGAPVVAGSQPSPTQRVGSPGARRSSAAGNVAQQAGKDALEALKIFGANPVGGLSAAYEVLGPKGALPVGIVFGVAYSVLCVLAMTIQAGFEAEPFFKFLFLSLSFPAGMMGGAAITRAVFGGKNSFESDVFIGGAATIPIAIFQFVLILMVKTMMESPVLLMGSMLFFLSISILMLFSGFTRIHKVSDTAATFMVPATIFIACAALYYICLENMVPGGMRMPF